MKFNRHVDFPKVVSPQPFDAGVKSCFSDMYIKGEDIILELLDIRSKGVSYI